MTTQEFRFVTDCDVETIVEYLMTDHSISAIEAFRTIYESRIYAKLEDPKTGLYLQSPAYIYEYLREELASTK